MAKKKSAVFTPEQASLIIEAHDIDEAFDGGEEEELLQANNPELYEAYKALKVFAQGKGVGQ